MDPNWFYSSLAQSTAAIVGVIAAVTSAQLVTHRSGVLQRRQDLRQRAQSAVDTYDQELKYARSVLLSLRDLLRDTSGGSAPDQFKSFLNPYTSPGRVQLSPDQISALGVFERDVVTFVDALGSFNPANVVATDGGSEQWPEKDHWLRRHYAVEPQRSTYWEELGQQRIAMAARWTEIVRSYQDLAFALFVFRSELVPRSLNVLVALLAAMLVTGVVVPLGFLSAEELFSKSILLGLFSILSLGVVLYLIAQIRHLRRVGDLSKRLPVEEAP